MSIAPNLTSFEKGKVVVAASFGQFADYFDFFCASFVSAFVWPTIFFAKTSAVSALSISIAAFALAYVARPVGAIVFGHFGDRVGRKNTMISTLLTLGVGVVGIAILPPYAVIGDFAPVLLVLFRLLLGFGLGGETGGGWIWAAEATSDSKRWPFWAGAVQAIGAVGITIPPYIFGYLEGAMDNASFLSFGWRIPFAVGASVVLLGAIIRYKTAESPVFERMAAKKQISKVPFLELIKKEPRTFLCFLVPFTQNTLATAFVLVPFSLVYLGKFGIPYAVAGQIEGLSTAIAAFCGCLVAAYLCTKVERKQYVWLFGLAVALILLYPLFLILGTAVIPYVAIAYFTWYFFTQMGAGAYPSAATSMLSARFRYSGAGLGIAIGAAISGVLTTLFLPSFLGNPITGLNGLITIYATISVIAIISLLAIKKQGDITA